MHETADWSLLQPPRPLRLRPMTADDIDSVMAIEQESVPTPWPASGYRHELTQNPRAFYAVATCVDDLGTEIVLGYAGHWLIADEVHVSIIAVAAHCRGRGLGDLLMLQVLHHAKQQNARLVTLEVRRNNRVAQNLYQKYTFAEVGERKGYYRDTGEDAVLMTLDFEMDPPLERWQKQAWQRLKNAFSDESCCTADAAI
jgi:ribosomal-protein-alanine N-acetyltransferase